MTFFARLNRPWVHFIVLGVLLFYLQGVFLPEPKPVVGPLSEARIDALQQQWFASVGRLPTPEQQTRMLEAELDRDMLIPARDRSRSPPLRYGGIPASITQYAFSTNVRRQN